MQSIPLAVLKPKRSGTRRPSRPLHAIHTACGIETTLPPPCTARLCYCMQSMPLAVLKHIHGLVAVSTMSYCMQSIPLAVLKQNTCERIAEPILLHAIHTACGIETLSSIVNVTSTELLHAIHTACGVETEVELFHYSFPLYCMQSIPLAVLKRWYERRKLDETRIACNPYRLRY